MIETHQKYIAYYRVSTDKQGVRGLGMESQRMMVEDYIKSVNGELIDTFLEVVSGKRNDRKGIHSALQLCKKTGAILAVAKLDRLARDVLFIAQLVKSKIKFVTVESPNIDKNFIHMRAVFSEMETDFISARTKAALAVLKSRGVVLGNPRLEAHNIKRKEKSLKYIEELSPIITGLKENGYNSLRKLATQLTRMKIKTPKGCDKWQINQIVRILKVLKSENSSFLAIGIMSQ